MLAELTTQPAALLERWPERAGLAENVAAGAKLTLHDPRQPKTLPWGGEKGTRRDTQTEGEAESVESGRDREREDSERPLL